MMVCEGQMRPDSKALSEVPCPTQEANHIQLPYYLNPQQLCGGLPHFPDGKLGLELVRRVAQGCLSARQDSDPSGPREPTTHTAKTHENENKEPLFKSRNTTIKEAKR